MTSLSSKAFFVVLCVMAAVEVMLACRDVETARTQRELRKEVAGLRSRVALEKETRMQADTEVWSNLVVSVSKVTDNQRSIMDTVTRQNRILHELVLLQTLKKEK